MSVTSYGNDVMPTTGNPEIAASATDIIAVNADSIRIHGRDQTPEDGVWTNPASFFGIPPDEAAWGTAAAWDQLHGRWVIASTSWQYDETSCTEGYLLLAVSTSPDPLGTWISWRIPIGANSADGISLGLSDTMIALAGNEYPLDGQWVACLALPFSGARLRVMDWADVLDGGSLTVTDLTPSSPRRYWSWLPARNVPVEGSDSAGAGIQLIVDHYDGSALQWGDVGYGVASGSSVEGTATLSLEDLTADAIVPRLTGPPWMGANPGYVIEGSLGEGSGIDEAAQSVAWRAGTLMFTAASSCTPDGDTSLRACLRVVTLDTASPSAVDDREVGVSGGDSFLGAAGFSRDGTTMLLYSRGTASFGMWSAPGETLATATPAQVVDWGDSGLPAVWSNRVRIAADPADAGVAWTSLPLTALYDPIGPEYAVRADLTGAPSGTASAPAWTGRQPALLDLLPAAGSPITRVFVSNSPDTQVIDGQTRLAAAKSIVSMRHVSWSLTDGQWGGSWAQGPRSIYVQWVTSDYIVSPIIEVPTTLDTTGPRTTGSRAFVVPSKLGSTVRVRFQWLGDDGDGIGVASYRVWSNQFVARCTCLLDLPPTATSAVLRLKIGLGYAVEVKAADALGNEGGAASLWTRPVMVQDTSSSVHYRGSWSTVRVSSASGGSVRRSTRRGSTATITKTGIGFAIVATKGPNEGRFAVYVDGVRTATIDAYRSRTAYRQLVWQTSFAHTGTHKITVKVLHTSGRTRVDLDGFLVLQDSPGG